MNLKQSNNEKKHNYFYKITNLINGKYYYGIHSTDNINEWYMGSGEVLKRAFVKYGKENFKKEIIADYHTRHEASEHERMVVTKELVELDECYNVRTGGENDFTFTDQFRKNVSIRMTGTKVSETNKEKLRSLWKGVSKSKEQIAKSVATKRKNGSYKVTEEQKKKISNTLKSRYKDSVRTDVIKIKCSIDGIQYNSLAEAGRALNLIPETISYRLKSKKFPAWIFIEKYKKD